MEQFCLEVTSSRFCIVNNWSLNVCMTVLRRVQKGIEVSSRGFARVQKGLEVSSRGFARVQEGLEVGSRDLASCTKGL